MNCDENNSVWPGNCGLLHLESFLSSGNATSDLFTIKMAYLLLPKCTINHEELWLSVTHYIVVSVEPFLYIVIIESF